MVTLRISEELAGRIEKEAAMRGVSVEEYLRSAVLRERSIAARLKIETEQEWWLNLPLTTRAKYEGEFVAIHEQTLVDHDRDANALRKRVQQKFRGTSVLVMPAEGPKEIRIFSPRLIHS